LFVVIIAEINPQFQACQNISSTATENHVFCTNDFRSYFFLHLNLYKSYSVPLEIKGIDNTRTLLSFIHLGLSY
jgi:hypothetical protein